MSGVATVNFVAEAHDGRRVFVKAYQPEADVAVERAAIELSEFAGTGGVPTARVVRTARGDVVHEDEWVAMSVWEFVVGESAEDAGLDASQMLAAGTVTGRMHRVLSAHPEARPRSGTGTLCDVGKSTRKIERVLGIMSRGTTLDPNFRAWATEVLVWRRGLMPRMAAMLERLPPLTSQVVHGDLAMPNVLFHAGQVAAVIDFRPPSPRPVAWEISRLGCDPRTVLRGDEWVRGLLGLLVAYRDENPQLPDGDLVATVRAWAETGRVLSATWRKQQHRDPRSCPVVDRLPARGPFGSPESGIPVPVSGVPSQPTRACPSRRSSNGAGRVGRDGQ